MHIEPTAIPEVLIIRPDVYRDDRGFFLETYRRTRFEQAGIASDFPQENRSGSRQETLRGLHFQIRQVQGKLIQAVYGEIFDVAVDLRKSSGTFGQWTGQVLNAQDHLQMWIPPGFAHGFYVLSEWAEVIYKVTDVYAPEWERTIHWDDPRISIDWPLIDGKAPLVSEKDGRGLAFGSAPVFD
ncbi:MAG: dTDP-4-dehydrorhamnose 3,5-epimerase [Anaerolineales bacterium]|nr:dTDP-4-dehydrorhamnose 3,5-epimerase [Anaerolineales bacterium]